MFHNVNDLIKKEICSDSDNDTIEPEKKVEVNVQLVKRHSYSLGEKLEMIKELRVGKESYESLEEKYQLHRSLLQLWIKKENVYKAKLEKEPNLANMKKLRASKFSR